jgi:hypothetical protein
MQEVASSIPSLDFYLLCEPICVSLPFFLSSRHAEKHSNTLLLFIEGKCLFLTFH